jgi:hypothetical protein
MDLQASEDSGDINLWLRIGARVATELILEVRYMLRSLGVALDGPTLMLGDNMSVVLNTTVPSSVLKKKHHAIAYHRVREAIAARIMRFAYIKSEENVSDVLTKPLSNEKFHYLIKVTSEVRFSEVLLLH